MLSKYRIAILVFCWFAIGFPASALAAVKFSADLSTIKVLAEPGQVFIRNFKLTLAPGEKPTQFKAHLVDWWRSEDGKSMFYKQPGTLKSSCGTWIKVNPVESVVAPGGTLNVRISFEVPANTRPGGYWCALSVDEVANASEPPVPGSGAHINSYSSVIVGIFVYVGTVSKKVIVQRIAVDGNTIQFTVRNDGDCPLGIGGRVEFLKPGSDKPVATTPIARIPLLPEPINTAAIEVRIPAIAELPRGSYLVRVLLDIGLDHYYGAQKTLEIKNVTEGVKN